MSVDPFLLLFVLSLGMTGVGLGSALLACPRWLPLPAGARFLCGVSLSPFAVGLVVLLLFAGFPGIPWWVVHAAIAALTGWALVHGRVALRGLLRRTLRAGRRLTPAEGLALLVFAGLLAVIAMKLNVNASAPLIAFDALQYAREAMALAASRDMADWVGHTGNVAGTLRGDIHHPVFPAYLSWALQFSAEPGAGYRVDHALRWAFQATLLALLVALPVPVAGMRLALCSFLPIPLVLMVPQFALVSDSATRDAFRLVPLVLVLALLLRLGGARARDRLVLGAVPAITVGCMLALMGHTLNGVVVVLTVAGWALWVGALRSVRTLLLGGSAAAIGLAMGAWTYADAWWDTGSIQGSGVLMYGALADSPMLAVIRQLEVADMRGVQSLAQRTGEMLVRDGRGFAVAGVLAAIALVVAGWRRPRHAARPVVGASVIALFVALPVIGVFDVGGYQLSQWFVTNQRYLLHWYVYLMLPLVGVLVWGQRLFPAPFGRWIAALALAALCAACYLATVSRWYQNTWDHRFVEARIGPMRQALEAIRSDRLVLEDARWNYYLGNRHVVMYATPTKSLFAAQSEQQFEQAFRQLGAGGVVLVARSLDVWWAHSPLSGYLEAHACRTDLGDTGLVLFLLRSDLRAGACP